MGSSWGDLGVILGSSWGHLGIILGLGPSLVHLWVVSGLSGQPTLRSFSFHIAHPCGIYAACVHYKCCFRTDSAMGVSMWICVLLPAAACLAVAAPYCLLFKGKQGLAAARCGGLAMPLWAFIGVCNFCDCPSCVPTSTPLFH